jgi:hypothetical protein
LFFDNLDSGSSGICKHNAIWVIGLRIGSPTPQKRRDADSELVFGRGQPRSTTGSEADLRAYCVSALLAAWRLGRCQVPDSELFRFGHISRRTKRKKTAC